MLLAKECQDPAKDRAGKESVVLANPDLSPHTSKCKSELQMLLKSSEPEIESAKLQLKNSPGINGQIIYTKSLLIPS